MLKWPNKDPDEVLDYGLDWLGTAAKPGRLFGSGDTIVASTWDVPSGITKDSDLFSGSATTIWLSAGTDKTRYVLTNHIITAGGRHMDQSVKLLVKTK